MKVPHPCCIVGASTKVRAKINCLTRASSTSASVLLHEVKHQASSIKHQNYNNPQPHFVRTVSFLLLISTIRELHKRNTSGTNYRREEIYYSPFFYSPAVLLRPSDS